MEEGSRHRAGAGQPTPEAHVQVPAGGLFICWSGERARMLAEALSDFVIEVIPELDQRVFVSPQIEKGARWFDEVMRQLRSARFGIVCLTAENVAAPWLHFEAGALVRGLHAEANDARADRGVPHRVFTYLHGVLPGGLTGPLAQYQSTVAAEADTCRLMDALAAAVCGDDHVAHRARFHAGWPAFERRLAAISVFVQELVPQFELWFRRKTFEEPIQQCTDQNWIARYDAVRQTHDRLLEHAAQVRLACPRYQVDLYERLVSLVDSYAMDIRALLMRSDPFPLTPAGELQIPDGIRAACERRRRDIRETVTRMLDPLAVPVSDQAAAFWLSDMFDQCKLLVHRCEHAVLAALSDAQAARELPDEVQATTFTESLWDLDRIYGYLLIEHVHRERVSAPAMLVRACVRELERLRASSANRSLMPMHYALGALQAALPHAAPGERASFAAPLEQLMLELRREIEVSQHAEGGRGPLDAGGQVRRTLEEIEAVMRRPASRAAAGDP